MAILPTLPTEILEKIVDESRDNRRTLAACAMAGRELLLRTRVHLFFRIHLGSPPVDLTRRGAWCPYVARPTRCDLFRDILDANPNLGGHVMELSLSEDTFGVEWIHTSTTLLSVAQRLLNIRTFSVRGGRTSAVLMQTMYGCMRGPSIQSVELCAVEIKDPTFLYTVFCGCHLRSLRLSEITVRTPSSVNNITAHNSLAVKSISISFIAGPDAEQALLTLITGMPPLIDMSRVHYLRLVMDTQFTLLHQWLTLCAPSFAQLDLRYPGPEYLRRDIHPPPTPSFPPTPQLRVIHFEIHVTQVMTPILQILSTLKVSNLTEIVFRSRRDGCFHTDLLTDSRWAELDSIVSSRFPNLANIRFESGRACRPWQALLRTRLPILEQYGILCMTPQISLDEAAAFECEDEE
ncbi:hypothetical protein MVEN_01590600 [Mycena venus]|uniref:Uncharacterized protein n=1 Tax=Mycena venus TaxID=2733690 RepID=A0A8H6XSC8_9AGAR|nr:hypothetical protein MVEN_01590600 [Mycena venus]